MNMVNMENQQELEAWKIGSRASLLKNLEEKVLDYHQKEFPLFILLFRLDNFSKIDKNRGVLGTRCVVKVLEERLSLIFNVNGCFYQLNADCFVFVLSDKPYDSSNGFLENIHKQLKQPVIFYYDIISVELSMGFAEMSPELTSSSDLLNQAKRSLKLSTKSHNNWRRTTCQQCKENNEPDRELFNELKHDIANVQLHLAGQPIYNFDSGELSIVEVLLRWHHDKHGAINPMKIIELAGRNGYLYYIAVYVCQQLADFLLINKSMYQNVSFSINFNMPQIINKKLIEHVFAIFDQRGIDRNQLIFESTETDALPVSFEDAAGHFSWIRQQGVQIAMDDFGAGYSTLALLTSIDVDLIKIDRSLVTDIENNPRRLEALISILQLCQRLKLNIVVEGIENKQQHMLLLNSDLSDLLVQGYFYGKPTTLAKHGFCQINDFIYQQQSLQLTCQGM